MNCKEAVSFINDYLDGELDRDRTAVLSRHLQQCPACRARLSQLEKSCGLLRSLPPAETPRKLEEQIMAAIAAEASRSPKKQAGWLKRHPGLVAAAIFAIIMTGSFFSMWNANTDIVIRGSDLDHIVIVDGTVLVPEGRVISGNLTVENARVQVDGTVKGNLTVIDGSVYLASTASVSGEITKINQAVSWLWYKVNDMLSGLFSR